MAGTDGPDEAGNSGPGKVPSSSVSDSELDRRRLQLDRALAQNKLQGRQRSERAKSGNASGYAAALRLSSEFIAAILLGAAIGWVIDRFAGTSPWGLIVFLLLGFCAGVLNVLRSAGMASEPKLGGSGKNEKDGGR